MKENIFEENLKKLLKSSYQEIKVSPEIRNKLYKSVLDEIQTSKKEKNIFYPWFSWISVSAVAASLLIVAGIYVADNIISSINNKKYPDLVKLLPKTTFAKIISGKLISEETQLNIGKEIETKENVKAIEDSIVALSEDCKITIKKGGIIKFLAKNKLYLKEGRIEVEENMTKHSVIARSKATKQSQIKNNLTIETSIATASVIGTKFSMEINDEASRELSGNMETEFIQPDKATELARHKGGKNMKPTMKRMVTVAVLSGIVQLSNPCGSVFAGEKTIAIADEEKVPVKHTVEELIKLVKDKNKKANNRIQAIYTLEHMSSKEVVSALMETLKDDNAGVRSAAIWTLNNIGNKEAAPALIETLKDNDLEVRSAAIVTLGQIRSEEAVPLIIEALKDDNSGVHKEAIYALGLIGSKEAVPLIIDALKDEDINVRGTAIHALGQIRSEEAIPLIIEAIPLIMEALKDSAANIRYSAIYALGQMRNKESVPLIIDALKDEDVTVRVAAIRALKQIGSKEEVPLIIEAVKDKHARIRCAAIYYLGEMRNKEAIPLIIDALKDEDINVRTSAIHVLGKMVSIVKMHNIKEIMEALQKVSEEDYDKRVRELAKKTIEKLKNNK